MITIDPKAHGVADASKLKKSFKKDGDKKVKFFTNPKAQESSYSEGTKEVADIAPMLFLQEIDQYSEERQSLEEFGKKAIRCLKDLQLALMKGELKERHIHNLKDILTINKSKLNTPELASLIEEITTRIEVEIAKIELNRKQ